MNSTWPTRKLRELADIRVSNVDKKTIASEKFVKLCNYMDVYSNQYVTGRLPFMEASATAAELARFGLNKGDVIITKDSETPDDIGIAAVVAEQIDDLVCGYHLALIRPDAEQVDSIYLAKQLSTERVARFFALRASGSTRYGLPVSAIESVEIPTPPKPEQTKIAEILTTVDRAIGQAEALIAKQQRIKTGLMQDLLTRGIDELGNLRSEQTHKFKDSLLGRIPVEWEVVAIEKMCSDIADCPHSTPIYTNSGVPCIRTADMEPGHLLLDTAFCVDEASYRKRIMRLEPRIGDIIYSREGERLGIASSVGEERVCLGQRVMLLRPSLENDSDYLLWTMNSSDFYTRVISSLGATTSPHVNVKDIRKTIIKQPRILEQKMIGKTLLAQHSQLMTNKKHLSKLTCLKTALMQDLLTGRKHVTGLLKKKKTI
jgi:type I restriction enzyme S subunit